MKQYRLIEVTRVDNRRCGKRIRTTIWTGPDKAAFKQAIHEWHENQRKPWAEIARYYGSKLIYAYEL